VKLLGGKIILELSIGTLVKLKPRAKVTYNIVDKLAPLIDDIYYYGIFNLISLGVDDVANRNSS
jgi:hypothetical protein